MPQPAAARLPRHLALCCDFDGTLAHDGTVAPETIEALKQLAASGRKLVMVTGRELPDLRRVFPDLELFDRVVAENGALLLTPATQDEVLLADPPPEALVAALKARDAKPLSVGRSIIATREPHHVAVAEAIRDLGLECQVIYNKGAVMILPPGVNKASGLDAALKSLGLSHHDAVGIGDAENDHALLARCQVGVAVANAVPALKEAADIVTDGERGAGVRELVGRLLDDDLAKLPAPARHRVAIACAADDASVSFVPGQANLLITGRSGSGKSTATKGVLERLVQQDYSFCIVDPEGDYLDTPHAVVVGTQKNPLSIDEAVQALGTGNNIVFSLLGIALEDRPAFLAALVPHIEDRRLHTGQPHVLVVDEAHHMLGVGVPQTMESLGTRLDRVIMVTVHPDLLSKAVLTRFTGLMIIGKQPGESLAQFRDATGRVLPEPANLQDLEPGSSLAWFEDGLDTPQVVQLLKSRAEHRRHSRKYAEGELPEDRSFWFRGPQGKLKLRAQNLVIFLQMAEGVDDETWLFHLRNHEVSDWLATAIKDGELGAAVREIEDAVGDDAADSRALVRDAVLAKYTMPG